MQRNYLKEWRASKGITAAELARMTSTDRSQIGRLETGERRLTLEWMTRISQALMITPEQLLHEPPEGAAEALRGVKFIRPRTENSPFNENQSRAVVYGAMMVVEKPFKLVGIEGDEMSPTLLRGNLVLVDTTAVKPPLAGVYLITVSGADMVRRLQQVGDSVSVICDNSRYATVSMKLMEMTIRGKLTAKVVDI